MDVEADASTFFLHARAASPDFCVVASRKSACGNLNLVLYMRVARSVGWRRCIFGLFYLAC
jgi:hypothetical protein